GRHLENRSRGIIGAPDNEVRRTTTQTCQRTVDRVVCGQVGIGQQEERTPEAKRVIQCHATSDTTQSAASLKQGNAAAPDDMAGGTRLPPPVLTGSGSKGVISARIREHP